MPGASWTSTATRASWSRVTREAIAVSGETSDAVLLEICAAPPKNHTPGQIKILVDLLLLRPHCDAIHMALKPVANRRYLVQCQARTRGTAAEDSKPLSERI